MIENELIFNELKKGTEYGNNLLVSKFFGSYRKTICSYFKIQYSDAGLIVNDALFKIIKNIDSFEFYSEKQFAAFVNITVFNTAKDYLKRLKADKNRLKNEDITIISIDQNHSPQNLVTYETEGEYEDSRFLKENEKLDKGTEEESIDLTQKSLETEFLLDTDSVAENDKISFVKEIIHSFSENDQILLRLYLNGVSYKELAKFRDSSVVTTRQYITRSLLKTFFKRAANKLNINNKEVYEKFKKQNKRSSSKGVD